MQLEKIIGKLKTEKYGSRILEEIKSYTGFEHADNDMLNVEEGRKRKADKRLKTEKNIVLVESSADES